MLYMSAYKLYSAAELPRSRFADTGAYYNSNYKNAGLSKSGKRPIPQIARSPLDSMRYNY